MIVVLGANVHSLRRVDWYGVNCISISSHLIFPIIVQFLVHNALVEHVHHHTSIEHLDELSMLLQAPLFTNLKQLSH